VWEHILDGVMNNETKHKLRAKVESYLKRAEELKNIAKNEPVKKKALVDDGPGRGNSKDNRDDDDSGDSDRRRMMQKLEGKFYYNKFCISFTLTPLLFQELFSSTRK